MILACRLVLRHGYCIVDITLFGGVLDMVLGVIHAPRERRQLCLWPFIGAVDLLGIEVWSWQLPGT